MEKNKLKQSTEEKQLLLKDLSARLPYGVKVQCDKYPHPVTILYAGNINEVKFAETGGIEHINSIKPYLRPMSSMTEKEKKAFNDFVCIDEFAWNGDTEKGYPNQASIMSDGIDWLLSHHFDFRGLIEKGLALEAPESMYKEK